MAIKLQYNKTALEELKRQLSIRERALPILKNKETALRQEVKKLNKRVAQLELEYKRALQYGDRYAVFWNVFPPILKVKEVKLKRRNIVGIKVPELERIEFKELDISWVVNAAWIPASIEVLKEMLELRLRFKITREQQKMLEQARKKTTQKVNLYEKVQIPQYEQGIIRIKRFLEDKENIAKAAQKIVKKRNAEKTMAL